MKLNVDKEADALYLRLDDSPIVESEEVSPGIVLDYNESNEVVGVEILYLSNRSSNLNLSASLGADADLLRRPRLSGSPRSVTRLGRRHRHGNRRNHRLRRYATVR